MNRHMDHFRDARLMLDDRPIVEGFEGYIGCREKSGHRKEWHGYFLIDADEHLDPDLKYTLALADGSRAMIRASDIRDIDPAGSGDHAVEFYVIGDLRTAGRRRSCLGDDGRPARSL